MDEKTFGANLAAVIAMKEEKDKSLREEANRHWGEISSRAYRFDRSASHVCVCVSAACSWLPCLMPARPLVA
jgi:hypothetical protein